MKFLAFFLLLFGVSSCYQTTSDGDLRTVPVTNNPNLVPDAVKADPRMQM